MEVCWKGEGEGDKRPKKEEETEKEPEGDNAQAVDPTKSGSDEAI